MDSLQIQDGFEPYYAGRDSFPTQEKQQPRKLRESAKERADRELREERDGPRH